MQCLEITPNPLSQLLYIVCLLAFPITVLRSRVPVPCLMCVCIYVEGSSCFQCIMIVIFVMCSVHNCLEEHVALDLPLISLLPWFVVRVKY